MHEVFDRHGRGYKRRPFVKFLRLSWARGCNPYSQEGSLLVKFKIEHFIDCEATRWQHQGNMP